MIRYRPSIRAYPKQQCGKQFVPLSYTGTSSPTIHESRSVKGGVIRSD